MKIRLAPLNVPIERRFQTAAVLAMLTLPVILGVFDVLAVFVYWRWTWPVLILYGAWVYWDKKTPYGQGRPLRWLRRLSFWRHFRNYFPARLIVEKKLNKEKPYVLCFHPHGVFTLGLWANLAGLWGDAEEKLGISYLIGTLGQNFFLPIWREYLLGMGFVEVGRNTFDYILSRGRSIVVVIGGAREALDARPGTNELVLKCRMGFVKKALQHGASLVPIFSYGESDMFDNEVPRRGTKGRKAIDWFLSVFGFSTPLFHGRGVFNYDFGLLPYRSPVTTVVGPPLELPHIPSPTREDVAKYHKLYVEALQALHDRHKAVHKDINGHVSEMKIIE